MKSTFTSSIPTALFLSLFANAVNAQTIVKPVRVSTLDGLSSLMVTKGATQRLFYRVDRPGEDDIMMMDGTGSGILVAHGMDSYDVIATSATHCYYTRRPSYVGSSTESSWARTTPYAIGNWPAPNLSGVEAGGAAALGSKFIVSGSSSTAGDYGKELYSAQPGTSTPTLLGDINPGTNSSLPLGLMFHADRVYFTAENSKGRELWATNGTPAGTLLIKDILAGAAGSEPKELTSVGKKLYFSAMDIAGNREPWISDGTTAGTGKLKEISPSPATGSDPAEFTLMGTKVFFSANNSTSGRELWMSDGTAAGTAMVKDILAGGMGSEPSELTVFGNKVWFVAHDDQLRSRYLFATDGTERGTVKMLSLPAGTEVENLNVCNGKLFYVTRTIAALNMWCTDGTPAGTKLVKPETYQQANRIESSPMVVMDNWLYFSGSFESIGSGLWKVQ